MKNCPECSSENMDDANTCKNCGFPFEDSSSKILFGNPIKSENFDNEQKKETTVKPNLFQGRTESEKGNAKFPNWDIVPPNQIINPRIKQQ
jgi:hypothetical protein